VNVLSYMSRNVQIRSWIKHKKFIPPELASIIKPTQPIQKRVTVCVFFRFVFLRSRSHTTCFKETKSIFEQRGKKGSFYLKEFSNRTLLNFLPFLYHVFSESDEARERGGRAIFFLEREKVVWNEVLTKLRQFYTLFISLFPMWTSLICSHVTSFLGCQW